MNNTDTEGWGRPSLQSYIISRKKNEARDWPSKDAERIKHYRALHDQGRVTMCQGRDGLYTIQYAIPMKHRISRETYFGC